MPNYNFIDENSSTQVLDGTLGDKLMRLVIIPLKNNTGTVSIKDGSDDAIIVYKSIVTLDSFVLELGARANNTGGWTVITGADVQCLAVGE